MKDYLSFNDVCELLKITPYHLRSLIFKRSIPYLKVGRLIRFDSNDLTEWIKSNKKNGGLND